MSKLMISGKRKTSVAKASLTDGTGKVFYKNQNLDQLRTFHKLSILEPIRIYESVLGNLPYDISLNVMGGGKEGQIQAARLALAKALVTKTNNKELKEAYLQYDRHLLVADVRRKEQGKPGDSKARAKRQKSYR